MKKIKKNVAFVLSIALLLMLLPMNIASADNIDYTLQNGVDVVDSGYCGEDLIWEFDVNGLLTITGIGKMGNFSYGMTPWSTYASQIKAVAIGDKVTTISDFAFFDCENLSSISIPDGIISIGESVFEECMKLSRINIGKSVALIGDDAFGYCPTLENIFVDENNNSFCSIDGILFSKDMTELIKCPRGNKKTSYRIPEKVSKIGYSAFSGCSSLRSVTMGDGVNEIGDYAFNDCTFLSNIKISQGLTSIGNGAFQFCMSLASVDIPDGVIKIGERAFLRCDLITNVNIPVSTFEIGDEAFELCNSLTGITVDESSQSFCSEDGVLFSKDMTKLVQYPAGNKRTSYIIPNTVVTIGNYAFYSCNSLNSVTIPNGVKTIGEWAFTSCNSIKNISIPDSVTTIGTWAFHYCSSMSTITIGNGVTSIGYDAFEGTAYYNNQSKWENGVLYIGKYLLNAKTNISNAYTVKSGTKVIADEAFYDCRSLVSITMPDSVITIGNGAFYGCGSLVSITMPDSVITIGDRAFSGCRSLGNITIPDSVTRIGELAFYYCINLKEVVFENDGKNIEYIGENVFVYTPFIDDPANMKNGFFYIGNCLLKADKNTVSGTVYVKSGTVSIDGYAFSQCSKMTKVVIPNTVVSIGEGAFDRCTGLSKVILPEGVVSIGGEAFVNCSALREVVLPKTLEKVGYAAFWSCNSLRYVHYTGTQQERSENLFYNDELENATWDYEYYEIYCDIDGSGEISATDALLVLQYSIKTVFIFPVMYNFDPDCALYFADVDGNQKINAIDSLYILMYSIREIKKFPRPV